MDIVRNVLRSPILSLLMLSVALAYPTSAAAKGMSVVARVDFPRGLAIAPDGPLYAASAGGIKDSDCSYMFDCETESGRILGISGSTVSVAADGFPASQDPGSSADGPIGVSVEPSGGVITVTAGDD